MDSFWKPFRAYRSKKNGDIYYILTLRNALNFNGVVVGKMPEKAVHVREEGKTRVGETGAYFSGDPYVWSEDRFEEISVTIINDITIDEKKTVIHAIFIDL